MNRRRFLGATGATVTTIIAGCVGGQPDDGSTPDGPPTSFSIVEAGCGNQVSEAQVSASNGTVTVEGTIWGNDACFIARLDGVTHEGDTLTVDVASVRRDDAEGCAQCITEIDYRATVEPDPMPETVVVVHDGETVLRTSP